MAIRNASESDAEVISRLIASLAYYYCADTNADLPDWFANSITPQAVQQRIVDPAFDNYIYVEGDDIVGYIALQNDNHLYHLFVGEAQQGRGIARKLWQHVLQHSDSKKFTLRSSLYAVPVYERFGFRSVGPAGEKEGIGFQPMEYLVT